MYICENAEIYGEPKQYTEQQAWEYFLKHKTLPRRYGGPFNIYDWPLKRQTLWCQNDAMFFLFDWAVTQIYNKKKQI